MTRLLAALLLTFWAATAWAETLYVYSPGDGYLNLRDGPGSEFRIVREMYHGDVVERTVYGERWSRVRHASGWTGWASTRFLQPDPNRTHLIVDSPGDGFLNLRQGPSGSRPIIMRMNHRETVWLLGDRAGEWLRVEHAITGRQGWAHSRWLSGP